MRSILPPTAPPSMRCLNRLTNNPNLLPTRWPLPTISPAADGEPADNKSADIPVIAFAERADGDNSRDVWYENLLATLGSILAAASAAWFLIGRAPPRGDGGSEQMLVYEIEPMRR